jgi:hypothetical protein
VVCSHSGLERIEPTVVLKYPKILVAQIEDVMFRDPPNLEAIVG